MILPKVAILVPGDMPDVTCLEYLKVCSPNGGNVNATDYRLFWRHHNRRVYREEPGRYYVNRKGQRYYLELRL